MLKSMKNVLLLIKPINIESEFILKYSLMTQLVMMVSPFFYNFTFLVTSIWKLRHFQMVLLIFICQCFFNLTSNNSQKSQELYTNKREIQILTSLSWGICFLYV